MRELRFGKSLSKGEIIEDGITFGIVCYAKTQGLSYVNLLTGNFYNVEPERIYTVVASNLEKFLQENEE